MTPLQPNIFLSLGSNIGDRYQSLLAAIRLLDEKGVKTHSFSSVYETQPWGFSTISLFLNMVIRVGTQLEPQKLLEKCMEIEEKIGRVRLTGGYRSRIIDIDILFYGEQIVNNPTLKIPHPLIQLRRFVLQPMCEIAPDFQHPQLKIEMVNLLAKCTDQLEVNVWKTRNEINKTLGWHT